MSVRQQLFLLPQPFAVLDVETRYSAQEVGGWHQTDKMGVSIAVVYYSESDSFVAYTQDEIPQMAEALSTAGVIVGFNTRRFDYAVLQPHAPDVRFSRLPTLDLLDKLYGTLGFRVSLDNVAGATLGAQKSASGLLALQWWKEQRLDLIESYCQQDVALTRDVYLFGKEHGYVQFTQKNGRVDRVAVSW